MVAKGLTHSFMSSLMFLLLTLKLISPQTPIPTQNASSGGRERGILSFLGQKCFVTKASGSVNVCRQGCFAQLRQCRPKPLCPRLPPSPPFAILISGSTVRVQGLIKPLSCFQKRHSLPQGVATVLCEEDRSEQALR